MKIGTCISPASISHAMFTNDLGMSGLIFFDWRRERSILFCGFCLEGARSSWFWLLVHMYTVLHHLTVSSPGLQYLLLLRIDQNKKKNTYKCQQNFCSGHFPPHPGHNHMSTLSLSCSPVVLSNAVCKHRHIWFVMHGGYKWNIILIASPLFPSVQREKFLQNIK